MVIAIDAQGICASGASLRLTESLLQVSSHFAIQTWITIHSFLNGSYRCIIISLRIGTDP